MRGFLGDLRHALKLYRRTPFASLIAVGVLAVGFAFVSAFLSLYVDLVLRPHPGIDQAGRLVREGRPVDEAMAEAARRRLRPILMTTLTTILALLPLAFGIGEGADAQAPLARTVVGGLFGSSLITLGLIPAVYSLFHRGGGPDGPVGAART